MKDIIGLRRPSKTKKDKKGKKVASSPKVPSPAPIRRPTGISICDSVVDIPSSGVDPADPNDKGKRSAEGRPPSS